MDTSLTAGVTSPPASVQITQAQAYSYRVPESDSSKSRPTNVIVVLKAQSADGRTIQALGEGQPRTWRTGDDAGDYWAFLAEAVGQLQEQEVVTADPASALEAVRLRMADFAELAAEHAFDKDNQRPFRGTLLALEIALLDLVAKARQQTLAQLLGQRREAAPLYRGALTPRTSDKTLAKQLRKQADRHELVRLTGSTDATKNLDLLERATAVNRSREVGQPNKALWLDLNGALSREQADEFIAELVDAVVNYRICGNLLIEQPVPVKYGDHLAKLQKQADEALAQVGRPDASIRIIGDESVFDSRSVWRLQKAGGIGGINIRPAQTGGLLASIDQAERMLKANPEALIFLTRMTGASRLTASALRHLALALPRIDGAVVSSVVEKDLAMSRQVKTQDEAAADAREAAEQESEEEPTLDTSALRIIQSSHDDEPDSDDREESEEQSSADHNDGPSTVGDTPDESDDNAEQDEVADRIRRFRVRDVPGIGVELLFTGLVSDVQDAVTYPAPPEATYNGIPVTKYTDVDDLHPLGPNGSKGHLLEREALALGLNTTRYSKGAFTATDGEHEPVPFKWSRNPISSATSLALCTHKEATRMQLQQAGVPVPQGRTFARGDYATAKEFVGRIGYPVVVKPTMGVRGIGVVAGIQDEEQLDSAFELMSGSKLGGQDFIVEKHVHGADYRIVVIGDEVIAAIQREPASVFGDGTSTIAELLISKNIARKRNPHLWARPAKYDAAAQHELEKAGRDLDTVLPAGEQQMLANTCSLSQGGDSIDVLDEMHPSIKEASVAAVKAMPGLHFCGVDFLLEDHTKPLDQQDAGICELNAHAAIGNCEYPMFGAGRPVAKTMMRSVVEHFGLEANEERAENVALHLTIRGRVTRVNFRKWLQRRAYVSGVKGWVRNVDRRTVEAVLVGPTDPTTAMAAAAILGPKNAVPTAYEANHIPFPEGLDGFEIREDAPEGTPVEAIDAA